MAAAGRPALLVSLCLSRLSSCASRRSNSRSGCLITVRHTCVVPASFGPLWKTAARGLSPGKAFSLNACGQRRSWSRLHNIIQLTQFSSASDSPALSNTVLSEHGVDNRNGLFGRSSNNSGTVGPTAESVVPSSGETQASDHGSAHSSRKSKRMCYYHSQGLCTLLEDPVHLSKFSHQLPNLSVRGEDLKKVKAQPFDYFLVLDLEGMVEILEFPVVMVDAKTLKVVDHFHRFVRPAKMTEKRMLDYIRNKYGRWGLDRVWHDTAIPFSDVLPLFETWLESHSLWNPQSNNEKLTTAAFVTCGNWDVKTKIPEQCITSQIDMPVYFNEWINLKDIYFNFYKFRASGMLKMMNGLKLPMVGTHHVGLDDAHNITRVLQRMLVHGALIRITATRKAEDPKAVKFTFRFRIK